MPATDTTSGLYGPPIADRLRTCGMFQETVYPVWDLKKVDAVLEMRVTGSWVPDGSNIPKAILIGLSFGLLGPFLGPGISGHHELSATLRSEDTQLAAYTVQADSHGTFGLMANTGEVGRKLDEHQVSKLTNELANRIRSDWPRISQQMEKQ